jgi:hypothetical protein
MIVSRTRCSLLPAMPTGRANARPMTGSASSGHETNQVMNMRAAEAIVSSAPNPIKIFPISEV